MARSIQRSPFFITLALTVISVALFYVVSTDHDNPNVAQQKLADLEKLYGGRLGVYAINTVNNHRILYRAAARFPMCSTSKMMGVAAILHKSQNDPKFLNQRIHYNKEDLVVYSPVTADHVENGMTIAELCAATLTMSDNTAINLLMKQIGGPKGVTAFARSIGDRRFRLDRWEPELNSALPGDMQDTSTPLAMATSLQRLGLESGLLHAQREQLQFWLKNNKTGDLRIRAGVPQSWVVGDKTGTCKFGTTNDIGIIWPPNGLPIVLAIYFTQNEENAAPREDILASVTRIIMSEIE